ncbi:hypothetical protein IWQ61_003808 [Dispira simplex]|nr:hypothetical protein IWQ61_003808 [Dispira simplex]
MQAYAGYPTSAVADEEDYYYSQEQDKSQNRAILRRLVDFNQEFCTHRQTIYNRKMAEIHEAVREICAGTHPVYQEKIKELEETQKVAIHKAKLLCDYQLAAVEKLYTDEIHRAEEEYNTEKEELREKLRNSVEERLKRLREEKDVLDTSHDGNLDGNSRGGSKRNLRKRGADQNDAKPTKRKHPATITLPYMASDDDITDDLTLIKKPIPSVVHKKGAAKSKR